MCEVLCPMDRISDLPHPIVHQIMSHLSMREVARTSVLSKRWIDFRNSCPFFDFDQTPFLVGKDDWKSEVNLFRSFVDQSFLRFSKLKLCVQKFKLSIVENSSPTMKYMGKWLAMAIENGAKEIEIQHGPDLKLCMQNFRLSIYYGGLALCEGCPHKVKCIEKLLAMATEHGAKEIYITVEPKVDMTYILSRTILSAKSLCFHTLTSLTLMSLSINEQMVQKITSECLLLKNLRFNNCSGIDRLCVYEAFKLESLIFDTCLSNFPIGIDIIAPSLKELGLTLVDENAPTAIGLVRCPNLVKLTLGLPLPDKEFYRLISGFSFLEKLQLFCCDSLETLRISLNRLKDLDICYCKGLKTVHIDTPTLWSFTYLSNYSTLSLPTINAPCLYVAIDESTNTHWYLSLKEFIGASNHIKDLLVHVKSDRDLFDLDEFRRSSTLALLQVERLHVRLDSSCSATFFDGIFSICRPKELSVEIQPQDLHKFHKFNEMLQNKDKKSINVKISCFLKAIKIGSFIGEDDKKSINVTDIWPNLPAGKLWYHLDWLPEP